MQACMALGNSERKLGCPKTTKFWGHQHTQQPSWGTSYNDSLIADALPLCTIAIKALKPTNINSVHLLYDAASVMVPQMTCIRLHAPSTHRLCTPRRLVVRTRAAASTIKTAPPAPAPTVAPSTSSPEPQGLLEWTALADLAGLDILNGFTLRPNGVPSTAPTPTLPTSPDVVSTAPVLLYRDTNAWCPFCERVWLALEHKGVEYDTVLIDLRNKPDWYKSMVPTTLVPAARINGELVYESRDILMVR